MPDEIDWVLTTFEGNRRRQHEEFRALPLREKLLRVEEMCRLAEYFAARRALRVRPPEPGDPAHQDAGPDRGPS